MERFERHGLPHLIDDAESPLHDHTGFIDGTVELTLIVGAGFRARKSAENVLFAAPHAVGRITKNVVTTTIWHGRKSVEGSGAVGMVPQVRVVVAAGDTSVEVTNDATGQSNSLVFEAMAFVVAIVHRILEYARHTLVHEDTVNHAKGAVLGRVGEAHLLPHAPRVVSNDTRQIFNIELA